MLKIKKAELETVCGITSKFPANSLPEFAFAGKSNVGKSSLLNALVNRKALARTSSEPGKTQTVNFYNINDAFYFVDLPGYGYARVSMETKAKWGKMIEKYLRMSKVLKQVFLLIDMRHEPSADDVLMYEWIVSNGYTPVVILTKADKLSKNEQFKMKRLIMKKLGISDDQYVFSFSALSKAGRDELSDFIMREVERDQKTSENAAEEP